MPAWTMCSGVSKSGSPTPRLMTSSIVARMSKKRRMPDGGTSRTRRLSARSASGGRASVGSGGRSGVRSARCAGWVVTASGYSGRSSGDGRPEGWVRPGCGS